MKRFTSLLVAALSAFMLYAQKTPSDVAQGKPAPAPDRPAVFQCLPNSVFSQVFSTFDNAFYADNGYAFDYVTDDYLASGPFSAIRFWGGNFYACVPGTSQTFIINFYNAYPCPNGTPLYSFTKTATPVPTGIISFGNTEIYMVDISLGSTVNLLNGWVSISRVNPGDGCDFAWISLSTSNGSAVSHGVTGECINQFSDVFFCLGGNEAVPIASWALIVGIGLIAMTIILRFRRLI
jgi:hypothetical protein